MANANAPFELFAEVLDKLIETQVESAKSTSELRAEVHQTNANLKEMHKLLTVINGHFSNGFRAELKDHVAKQFIDLQEQLEEKAEKDKTGVKAILDQLERLIVLITSPWSVIKVFLFVAGLFGAIAGVVTVVLKLLGA